MYTIGTRPSLDHQCWAMTSRSFPSDLQNHRYFIAIFSFRREDSRSRDTREVAMQPTPTTVWKQVCQSAARLASSLARSLRRGILRAFHGDGILFHGMSEWNDPQFIDLSYNVVARVNRETSGTSKYKKEISKRKYNRLTISFSNLWTFSI